MGKAHGISGGGIESRQTSMTRAPKTEPREHHIDPTRPSQIGLMQYKDVSKAPLYYNKVSASTPVGPNHNFAVGPGAGRVCLPSGSQSKTPRVSDPPRGKNHW
jgi:hypothetical protein